MKDFLTLTKLSRDEINNLLQMASQMRRIVLANYKKSPQLLGKTVVGLFQEESVESIALNLAMNYLSGTCVISKSSQNLLEIAKASEYMGANYVAIKNENDSLISTLANVMQSSVINLGSKMYSPICALSYLLVIQTKLDNLSNHTIGVVGNGNSNLIADLDYALSLFNSSLVWYLPKDDVSTIRRGIVLNNAESVFAGADAIIDLGLQQFAQPERYYGTNFGISKTLIDKARPNIPLIGAKHIVDKNGITEYHFNTASTEASAYVATLMAVLYSLTKN